MSKAFRSATVIQPWSWVLIVSLACATAAPEPPAVQIMPMPVSPGTGLGGQRVMVLPLEVVRNGDPLGWYAHFSDSAGREVLIAANNAITHNLTTMAPRTVWLLPADIAKISARSAGYMPDPYTLDVSQFDPGRWHGGSKLDDPLAGDLRNMTSFTDSRLALIPAEVRFVPFPLPTPEPEHEGKPKGPPPPVTQEVAVLRVALVDTRFVVVAWVGDVVSDPATTFGPAVMNSLANHLGQALSKQ